MFHFRNFFPPFPDELLTSWISRLADANMYTNSELYKEIFGHFYHIVEFYNNFSDLYNCFPEKFKGSNTMAGLFNRLNVFNAYSAVMRSMIQTKYIYSLGSNEQFLKITDCFSGYYKICPECLAEESNKKWLFETRYLHRAHQIAGVTVCHKHGCALKAIKMIRLKYAGKSFDEIFDPANLVDIDKSLSGKEAMEYAVAANKLLNAFCDINVDSVLDLIDKKIKESGYAGGINDSEFCEILSSSPYQLYIRKNSLHNIVKQSKYFSPKRFQMIVAAILLVYKGDFDLFLSDLRGRAKSESLVGTIHNGFEIISESGVVKSYRCKDCGNEFLQTEWGIDHGFGCPYCIGKDVESFTRNLLEQNIDLNYKLISKPEDMYTPVKIIHKDYGNEIIIKPYDFIFKDRKCFCNRTLSKAEAIRRLERIPGFKLEKYTRSVDKATIRHVGGCGHSFEVVFCKFISKPKCRVCEIYQNTDANYKQRVQQLVGDEYELLSEYTGADDIVKFRHKPCGRIIEMPAGMFTRGCRCRHCNRNVEVSDLKQLADRLTSGHYTVLGNYSECRAFIVVRDNRTGKEFKVDNRMLMQEFVRVTPSNIIKLTPEEEAERIRLLKAGKEKYLAADPLDKFNEFLRTMYKIDDCIFTDDLYYLEGDRVLEILKGTRESYPNVKSYADYKIRYFLHRMCKYGYLRNIYRGIFVFSENKKEYTPDEILHEKYICRNGQTIGKILKASESGYPQDRYLSTKIKVSNLWYQCSIGPYRIFIRGITPEEL